MVETPVCVFLILERGGLGKLPEEARKNGAVVEFEAMASFDRKKQRESERACNVTVASRLAAQPALPFPSGPAERPAVQRP